MLRITQVCRTALPNLINTVRRTPAYLRHAPPGLYVTCDFEKSRRHATLLIDASLDGEAPLTNGTYLLTSTEGDDVSFRQAQSALVGLPYAQNASQASYFADNLLSSSLKRGGMGIPFDGIQTLVIPELNPFAAHIVKELVARLPQLKVACSPLTAAFLSDGDFCAGIRKALCENDEQLTAKLIEFADLPQTNLHIIEDGSTISFFGESRKLSVASGDLSQTRERWKRERRNKLKHFESYGLFLYDPAFHALLVGPSAGVHFPWLPFVVHEADAAALLLLPDVLASLKTGGSPLLEVWHVKELCERIATVLQKFPESQRVLTTCYGEFPGGADGYLGRLQQTAEKLEELRSRLGRRLSTDTVRDMNKWSLMLEEKIMKEILFTNTSLEKTSEVVLDAYKSWANKFYTGRIARALAQSAATLPPDALPKDHVRPSTTTTTTSSSSSTSTPSNTEGIAGVQLLKRHLEKRGMNSLSPIVEREEIDVRVFLAMDSEELKKVFKATFGVVKKMEMLQQELRASH
ncbi:putative serine peptidase [Trypanosoma theileri]|uniref:Putative serine peptidase n=1 Tax=Trypanosoma theileri TaxID=67003 RepID=A0A1X0P302_9TRYP|nr:putative serine peptidase [Trypanosoma theileri]ORC91073.1 putative serine peptidase [Trypanosoma theileri]